LMTIRVLNFIVILLSNEQDFHVLR
jgi:hypothetical protein